MLRSLVHVLAGAVVAGALLTAPPAGAVDAGYDPSPARPPAQQAGTYDTQTLVEAGHEVFGDAAVGLGGVVESLLARFGRPNGYIIGEEASGAIFGGLRYGEGVLNIRGMGRRQVFWQGPSFGWDFGGSGSRVMMLVYNLPDPDRLMQRYTGVDGSAYAVSGLSVTLMAGDRNTYVVPVRAGVGARLGVSLGYLKFTPRPTWNPF
jgi:hypothetical protein